jgi:NhaP-type Na+/H+ or K+/H+ antiporter
VPARVRHTLNLESGLNDGLALPFVLFFLVLASPSGNAATEATNLVGEAAFGAVVGVVVGMIGGRLHHQLPGGGITARYEGIYAIGFALLAFGVADVTFGNGLIAAFVAGIAMGAAERDVPEAFVEFSENVSSIFQVITFFVFGALIVATGYDRDIWPLVGFILAALLVARPAAIMLAFLRERMPNPLKLFIAWFGPKGVASMLFALLVLNSDAGSRTLIFDVAAFTILASIVAHGLTDTVGAGWIKRRMGPGTGSESDPP